MQRFRFAHLSDPHLPLEPDRLRGRGLLSKQLLSYLSWRRKRRHHHRPDVLAALVADIHAHAPDHVAVTGDIANISLPGEFTRGREWLESVGRSGQVSFIPGNHDAMVRVPFQHGLGLWRDYMEGDVPAAPGASLPDSLFPYVRQRGPVAFIGLNSGLPTPPLLATGRLGTAQVEALGDLLSDLGRQGLFRVVMVHHPVADGVVKPRKGLTDRARLRAVLARHGAEMLLHGHAHRGSLSTIAGPSGIIPCLTVPSASCGGLGKDEAAKWNLVTVTREAEGWRVQVDIRGYDMQDGIIPTGGYTLLVPFPGV